MIGLARGAAEGGVHVAFIDAEGLTDALEAAFGGRTPFGDALAAYQGARDQRVKPMYDFTCQLAALQPAPPPMRQLFGALHGNQEATNQFFSALTGADSIPQFFNPENIGRIVSSASAARS